MSLRREFSRARHYARFIGSFAYYGLKTMITRNLCCGFNRLTGKPSENTPAETTDKTGPAPHKH